MMLLLSRKKGIWGEILVDRFGKQWSKSKKYGFQDSPLSLRKEFIEEKIVKEVLVIIENFQPETKPKPEGIWD